MFAQAVLSLPAAAPPPAQQRSGGMMAGLGGMMAQGDTDTTPKRPLEPPNILPHL